MGLTKLDVVVIILVILAAVVALNQERFFRVRGDNIFGAVMTHRTLVERGWQSNVTVKGIDIHTSSFREKNGFIVDTEPEKIYFVSGGESWILLDHEDDDDIVDDYRDAGYRLLAVSSLNLEPTKEFNVTEECTDESYVSGKFYYTMESPVGPVTCDFLKSRILSKYGGNVECMHSGHELMLTSEWTRFDGDIDGIMENLHNSVSSMETVRKDCRTYVEG